MEEIWKDIKGYEGLYQVSNLGKIWSNYKNKILKTRDNLYGYKTVYLYKNKVGKDYYIHRLVAEHFINNYNNYPDINHKDENKENNKANNLEWCTKKYNNNYGNHNINLANAENHKPIIGINPITNEIIEFQSSREAERNGFDHSAIKRNILGKQKIHKGYIWYYKKIIKI